MAKRRYKDYRSYNHQPVVHSIHQGYGIGCGTFFLYLFLMFLVVMLYDMGALDVVYYFIEKTVSLWKIKE